MTNGIKRFPWFETALLLGYAAIGAMAVGHHVLWRDETSPWRIAMQSESVLALLRNARCQGPHLPPWHVLLWVATRFAHNLAAVQVVHLALATVTVAVFLYASPFRRIDKALFCFGYFPLFEYCVICRPYVLIWLAMFAFCALHGRSRRSLLWLAVVLFALANTDVLGTVMATAMIAGLVVDSFGRHAASGARPPQWRLALCIACAGLVVAAAQVAYDLIHVPHPGWPVPRFGTQVWGTLRCPWRVLVLVPSGFPNWPQLSWGYNAIDWLNANKFVSVLSIVMIGLLAITLRGASRWMWVAGCILMVSLSLLVSDLSLRHWGLLFILYVACRWIDSSPSRRPAWHAKLLTTLLAVQAVAGVYVWSAERTRPFSGARAAAAIIQSNHWENLLLIGLPADDLTSVQAYLDRDIYYLDFGGWSHVQFYDCACPPVEIGRAMATTCRMVEESGTNAVLILNHLLLSGDAVLALDKPGDILPVVLPDGRIARFKVSVAGLTAGMVGDENFTLYLIERERSPAIPSISRIILNPDNAEAHNNLGTALRQLGKLEEAIGQYEQALRLKPDYAEAHYNLGFMLSDQGKVQEAIGQYEQALRVKPDYADAHNNLGNALWVIGRAQEAIGHYEQALQIKPDSAEAHYNLALAFGQVGKLDEAIHHYERAVQIKPDYAEAHSNLGNALVQVDKLEEAIGHYEQALRLKPGVAEVHSNLGVAFMQAGRPREAITHWEQALLIRPDLAEVHYYLGLALIQLGKVQEAIGHYEQALRIKPDFTDARNALAKLQARQ